MTINHCLIHGDTLVAGVCPKCEFSTEPALLKLTEDLSRSKAENEALQEKIDQIKADALGVPAKDARTGNTIADVEKLLTAERLKNTDLEVKLETEQISVRDLKAQLKTMTTAATVDKCLGCAGGICGGCKQRDAAIAELQKETVKEPELKLGDETPAETPEKTKVTRGRPKKDK